MTHPPTAIPIRWPAPGDQITTDGGATYDVGSQLNEGGYALVFEGLNRQGGAIALKVYKPANRPFDEVRNQWQREAAIMRKLRHQHVTAIVDAFVLENLFFIVMERAWGSVHQFVQQVGPLPDEAVGLLAEQVLEGLVHTHANGVLHRDLTIHNTLVFADSRNTAFYKLADFGVSKEFAEPWTPMIAHTQIAHPSFIPPEHLMSTPAYSNERTDLHQLGLLLLYARIGALPVQDGMPREQAVQIVVAGTARQQAEAIGTHLGDFIAVLCRRTNDARFVSAVEALKYLRKLKSTG